MFAYDPSFFIEDDGTTYLVFGNGWVAKMQADLGKGLAEKPHRIPVEEGQLYAGKGGCQIFKKDGKYHLLAANQWGDVIERTADKLDDPFREPKIAFAQTEAAVFTDAKGQTIAVTSSEAKKQN